MSSLLLKPPNPLIETSNLKFFSVRKSKTRAELQTHTSNSPLSSKTCISLLDDLHLQQVIEKQSKEAKTLRKGSQFDPSFLREAYIRCQKLCAEYAKTFYLGTLLMTEERKRATWALYVWCRRTDDLVDGPNAHMTSSNVLDRWEDRLEDIFNGCPYDVLDAALVDTIQRFPLDIKPFRDMIKGMKMDLRKDRYENFEELYHYCYYVAGTVGLMTVPIMEISPCSLAFTQSIYGSALCLGIGNQLTNILRDVGEDALKGRIYLPQDELREFGLKDEDIFSRKITEKWKEFMKMQITRARTYFKQAEQGVCYLDSASKGPVLSSLILYQRILDEIEKNDYDNLTKRAYVGRANKILTLPLAYVKATGWNQVKQVSKRKG